jgi:hypothetical protein
MRSFRARSRSGGDDRGAVLVEAALLTPIFFLLIFGIVEFSFGMRAHLTTGVIAESGARSASIAGTQQDADGQILAAVSKAASNLPADSLKEVVIFKASGPDDTIPAACQAGGVSGVCNHYQRSDLDTAIADFDCSSAGDNFWCPTSRNASLSGPPDYVGVWVRVRHDYFTGFFGDGMDLTRTKIMRLEPNEF